ncbi:MAG: glucose 1-dehydrogenase [Anaerolineales bacterium]|nr:glucose 1-dehydrogenase [Anaerolineales bacterium]
MKLQNRVAIVTGGAQGIGQAIAQGLAREGAAVVIADLKEDKAAATAASIIEAGGRALAVKVNVLNLADLQAMVDQTLAHFGQVDILVNNAGMLIVKPFLEMSEADWDLQMGVNLKSAFFATQRVAEAMIRAGRGGRIVNVASTSSFTASTIPTVPYDISKAGVLMLTKSSAVQLARHGINVNAIAPGTIDTELARGALEPEKLVKFGQVRIPIGRLGQPEDLVGAVVFLCSDDSQYVLGHTLVVDGGWLA